MFGRAAKILISGNSVKLEDGGFFGSSSTISKTSASTVAFPGFWKDSVFALKGNRVELEKGAFAIEHNGNRINFVYSGFFGINKVYTMIQSSNSTYFYDETFNGYEIRRDGQNIIYFQNGKKIITLNVVKTM